MLASHPDTTWFSQFSVRDGSIPGRRRLPFYGQIDRLSRSMFRFDWNKRPDATRRDRFVARPSEAQSVWRYIIPPSEAVDLPTSVERLRRIVETESGRWGTRRFLIKYPYLSLHVPVLIGAYPGATFLHMVRDGRAVALSLKAWLLKDAKREYVFRDGREVPRGDLPREQSPVHSEAEGLTRAAHYWLECIRMVQAEKGRMDLVEVRYEDFCTDIHGHLSTLLERTGLPVDAFPFDQCPLTLTPTNDRWTRSATPSELEMLDTLLADELRLYSYV